MKPIDYTGEHGGLLALAFGAGATLATSMLMLAAKWIWSKFGEARIKELQAARAEDNARCEREVGQLRDRVVQLETLLTAYGPPPVRQAIVAARSNDNEAVA